MAEYVYFHRLIRRLVEGFVDFIHVGIVRRRAVLLDEKTAERVFIRLFEDGPVVVVPVVFLY
ncbi:hypothetical protein AB1398_04960, partial [Hydrogenibacillus schlegelii]